MLIYKCQINSFNFLPSIWSVLGGNMQQMLNTILFHSKNLKLLTLAKNKSEISREKWNFGIQI